MSRESAKHAETYATLPFLGVAKPDLQSELRIHIVRRRIVVAYRVLPSHVEILRFFTNGRDDEAIMGRD